MGFSFSWNCWWRPFIGEEVFFFFKKKIFLLSLRLEGFKIQRGCEYPKDWIWPREQYQRQMGDVV